MQALDAPPESAVVHGSTVGSNSLLERHGARTALITTPGFADILAIGRQNRPELYDLVPHKPEPLVPGRWRFEVTERITAQGEVLQPLLLEDVRPILAAIEAGNVQSVAMSLLFSFLWPQHERRIREWLSEKTDANGPHLHVSLSSEILPEYREYERTSTTVINAYVAPLMGGYLRRVARGVAPRPLAIMQSSGGIISARKAGNQAARTVLSGPAGGVVGARSPHGAAWDVMRVANVTMERAIRRISVERGHDPRRFTLVAFGGAGPLHACELAHSLHIPRVLVPAVPGVLSALGMLLASPTRDYSRTVMRRLEPHDDAVWLEDDFSPLVERAMREMAAEGYDRTRLSFYRSLDMRYVGQSHELTVPYDGSRTPGGVAELLHAAHEQRYGFRQEEAPAEIVNVRLSVEAPAIRPPLPQEAPEAGDASTLAFGQRQVWFGAESLPTALYRRQDLNPGHTFGGPAVVFQYDTTTVVPPHWRVEVDSYANLLLPH